MSEENKVEFYKWNRMGSLTFSVLNDGDFKEDYSVWDNKSRRFLRNGMLQTKNGASNPTVEDSKYINRMDWTNMFGDDFRKSTQYIYNVEISGVEHKIGFSKSIHDKIQDMIKTVGNVGGNVNNTEFTVTSNGKPGLERKYEVTIKNKNNTPIEVQGSTLTEAEQRVIQTAKGFGNVNEAAFVTVATQQGITEDRAKELFKATF